MSFGGMQSVYVGMPIPEQEFGSSFHNPGKTDVDNNFIKQFADLIGFSAADVKNAVKMSDEQYTDIFGGKDIDYSSDLEGLANILSAMQNSEELLELLSQHCENKESLIEAGVFDVQSVFEIVKDLKAIELSAEAKNQIRDIYEMRIKEYGIEDIENLLKQDEVDEAVLRDLLAELKQGLKSFSLATLNPEVNDILEGFWDNLGEVEDAIEYINEDLLNEVFSMVDSFKVDDVELEKYDETLKELRVDSVLPSVQLVAVNVMNRQQYASRMQQQKIAERQQKAFERELKRLDKKRASRKRSERKKIENKRIREKNQSKKAGRKQK